MIVSKKEDIVLLNFLKSGLSTRELDRLLGYSSTRGWKSWKILKKYGLADKDKGKLFVYSERQSMEIISLLVKEPNRVNIDALIKNSPPRNIEKYKGSYVLAKSEQDFYNIFSGETRNIIKSFFNPKRKLVGHCQLNGCNHGLKELETVHYSLDRPPLFMRCAYAARKKAKKLYRYDVYKVMKCFLESHARKKRICFLCKKHHNEFHRLEKTSKKLFRKFKSRIIFI